MIATTPLSLPEALSAFQAACWATELTVSSTVAPFFGFPLIRSMRLCTSRAGSVPARSLFSACSIPVWLYSVSYPVTGAYIFPNG